MSHKLTPDGANTPTRLVPGNWRTESKPLWTSGEHEKLHTDSNASSGLNQELCGGSAALCMNIPPFSVFLLVALWTLLSSQGADISQGVSCAREGNGSSPDVLRSEGVEWHHAAQLPWGGGQQGGHPDWLHQSGPQRRLSFWRAWWYCSSRLLPRRTFHCRGYTLWWWWGLDFQVSR